MKLSMTCAVWGKIWKWIPESNRQKWCVYIAVMAWYGGKNSYLLMINDYRVNSLMPDSAKFSQK